MCGTTLICLWLSSVSRFKPHIYLYAVETCIESAHKCIAKTARRRSFVCAAWIYIVHARAPRWLREYLRQSGGFFLVAFFRAVCAAHQYVSRINSRDICTREIYAPDFMWGSRCMPARSVCVLIKEDVSMPCAHVRWYSWHVAGWRQRTKKKSICLVVVVSYFPRPRLAAYQQRYIYTGETDYARHKKRKTESLSDGG